MRQTDTNYRLRECERGKKIVRPFKENNHLDNEYEGGGEKKEEVRENKSFIKSY